MPPPKSINEAVDVVNAFNDLYLEFLPEYQLGQTCEGRLVDGEEESDDPYVYDDNNERGYYHHEGDDLAYNVDQDGQGEDLDEVEEEKDNYEKEAAGATKEHASTPVLKPVENTPHNHNTRSRNRSWTPLHDSSTQTPPSAGQEQKTRRQQPAKKVLWMLLWRDQ